jgi:hypothetical protein
MTSMGKKRERRTHWQRVAKLILGPRRMLRGRWTSLYQRAETLTHARMLLVRSKTRISHWTAGRFCNNANRDGRYLVRL